jgi:hypothetical protein
LLRFYRLAAVPPFSKKGLLLFFWRKLPMQTLPAVQQLKAFPGGPQLSELLGQFFAEKGFSLELAHALATDRMVDSLFGHLLMHMPERIPLRQALLNLQILPAPNYTGTTQENRQIDRAIWQADIPRQGLRATCWPGASTSYFRAGLAVPPTLRYVRILIIGAGAAGILAARALWDAGFRELWILDRDGAFGGIWQKDGLKQAPHAVPFQLSFEHQHLLPAPRPGGDVTKFLTELASPLPAPQKARVFRILPGDLDHHIQFEDEYGFQRSLKTPIVVNAIGVGEPLEPNRPGTMTSEVPAFLAGRRWQEAWSWPEAHLFHGQSLTFVSLSNSTLEMLRQIHEFWRQGLRIEYQVLTHYPMQALFNPSQHIEHRGKNFRLFRNLENHNLLRLAGDLEHVKHTFERARDTDRILPSVRHWKLTGANTLQATTEDGKTHEIAYHTLYTLIGYGPKANLLKQMGLSVNHEYLGAVDQDYDGEAQRHPGALGRERVWPGYFCYGIRNAHNPNEVLLPGLLHRLPNLVTGVILRAMEFAQQVHARLVR